MVAQPGPEDPPPDDPGGAEGTRGEVVADPAGLADREKVAIGLLLAAIIGVFTYRAHQRERLQLFTPVPQPLVMAVDGWDLPPPEPPPPELPPSDLPPRELRAGPLASAATPPSAGSAAPDPAQQEALSMLRAIVTRCGRAEHAAGRKFQAGLLTLKVAVEEGGRIGRAAFAGDAKRTPEFDACVAKELETLVVPAAVTGIELSLELNLR